eukprot:2280277-Pyramimonas_sp.AAC.1
MELSSGPVEPPWSSFRLSGPVWVLLGRFCSLGGLGWALSKSKQHPMGNQCLLRFQVSWGSSLGRLRAA